jgi:hypothetical protein
MNAIDFLKTIYVGDRGCKSILIDGWNNVVKVQVTCISRVRSDTWNYYTAEDITDGFIVFEGVSSIAFEPTGPLPNDAINEITATHQENDEASKYLIIMNVNAVDSTGNYTDVNIRIQAESISLEDPLVPGIRISH